MNYFMAVTKEGGLYGWGMNNRLRMGIISSDGVILPTSIPMPAKIKTVACGQWHSLALSETGIAFSAGDGKHGELGRDGGAAFA